MRVNGSEHNLSPRPRRRLTSLRRRQAEQLAAAEQAAAAAGRRRPPFVAILLAVFLLVGLVASLVLVLGYSPESTRAQLAFLAASGVAVWGLVGLAVLASRRGTPARQADLVAYDAIRQGLLVAGCLELNLATRMLDLWTPLVGGLLVAVFAVFEVVTLGRRTA